MQRIPAILFLSLVVLVACERAPESGDAGPAESAAPAPTERVAFAADPTMLMEVTGFSGPESVIWDSIQDVYFVANINGDPTAKDGNGFISRVRPDGAIDSLRFIGAGRDSVFLHAPKGMAIIGSTLWVADIDRVRAFHRETGTPVGGIDLSARGVEFLNDVEIGADGSLYVSETATDRIFRVEPSLRLTTILEGGELDGPNGLLWDHAGARLLIASFNGGKVLAWTPGDSTTTVVATGPEGLDGFARFHDGAIYVSTLSGNAVLALGADALTSVIASVASPADIRADAHRGRLLVPMLDQDRLQIWGRR